MAYATQEQLTLAAGDADRFLSLSDWDGDRVADANVIAEAQKRADAWVDSFLRLRFSTPLTAPEDDIVRIAAEEAIYWMRWKRGMVGPEDIKGREDREKALIEYREGKRRPDEPNPPKSTAVQSAWVSNDGDVSRESLKGGW